MLAVAAFAVIALAYAGSGRPNAAGMAVISEVPLSDDDGGAALFDVHDLAPGRPMSRCLNVSYDGPPGVGPVRLAATGMSGSLAAQLTITAEVGSGGGFNSCDGFTGSAFYAGPLAGLQGTDSSWLGVSTGWSPDGVDDRTYRITVVLADGDAGQGATASCTFQWLMAYESAPAPLNPTLPATPPLPATTTPSTSPPAAPPSTDVTVGPSTSVPPVSPAPRAPAPPPNAQPHGFLPTLAQAWHDAMLIADRLLTRHRGFPIALILASTMFLLMQKSIDRRDPKLMLAPVLHQPKLPFVDLPDGGGP
jgi:hypothetical protein